MSNVALSPHFSNGKNKPLSFGVTRKKSSKRVLSPLVEFRKDYTQANVCKQLSENFFSDRRTTFYTISLALKHKADSPLNSKEQKESLPTYLDMRKAYRCNQLDHASKADHLRIALIKQGILTPVKIIGKKDHRLTFSHKFYMMFCLNKLKDRRQGLIAEQSSICNYSRDDYKERLRIETQILNLEKKIREFKATQGEGISEVKTSEI